MVTIKKFHGIGLLKYSSLCKYLFANSSSYISYHFVLMVGL